MSLIDSKGASYRAVQPSLDCCEMPQIIEAFLSIAGTIRKRRDTILISQMAITLGSIDSDLIELRTALSTTDLLHSPEIRDRIMGGISRLKIDIHDAEWFPNLGNQLILALDKLSTKIEALPLPDRLAMK